MSIGTNKFKLGFVVGILGILLGAWTSWKIPSIGIVKNPDEVYDFIIVGAGTAGSVLASRLSENSSFKILLIEAGGEEPWLSSIPLAVPLLQKTDRDWQYKTVPQKNANEALFNRESFWPRGKLLGGSGQLNFNIHMYGTPQDFDSWETEYGAEGWGYEEMRKYANKAECLKIKNKLLKSQECSVVSTKETCEERRSTNHRRTKQEVVQCGDPYIRKIVADSELSKAFTDAGREIGLPVGNLNEDIDYGVMAAESSVYEGKRWTVVNGYLRPALGRTNLHVMINTHVIRIIFNGTVAVGVEYFQNGDQETRAYVYAKSEVILSSGSINTPVLLIHSGIGPKEVIHKLQIPEISLLEGVGENLQDHLNLPLYVSLRTNISLNLAKLKTISNLWDYLIYSKGDFGRSAIEGVATSTLNGENPEVMLILFNMGAVDKNMYSSVSNMKPEFYDQMFPGMSSESSEGFILLASCLHPQSRGRIVVESKSPKSKPFIEPNYLQDPYDVTCTSDAYRLALKFTKTATLQSLGASLQLPKIEKCTISSTDIDIDCIVRTFAITGYHPIGTARMGKPADPLAVVNSQLKVRGVKRLRVVDASVMPTQISGTPNSAIIVIAEKAADLIKEEWKKLL